MTGPIRTITLALLGAGLAASLLPAAAGTAVEANSTASSLAPPGDGSPRWRMLFTEEVRDGTGALRSRIDPPVSAVDFPVGRFSPSGSLLAGVGDPCGDTCSVGEGAVAVYRPDGTRTVVGAIENFQSDGLAWNPDESSVAVIGARFGSADVDVRIYDVPLDGSTPTMIFATTRLIRPQRFGGISWNSRDSRIAFIADQYIDEGEGPVIKPGGVGQVWTVPPAAGATPTRYTGEPDCTGGGCVYRRTFTNPTWSPDGSDLAVAFERQTGDFDFEYEVGLLSQGALEPTRLREVAVQGQIAWSADGDQLAYGIDDVSGDFYDDVEVIGVGTGQVVARVRDVISPFVDWQPCPTGSCPVFGEVVAPPRPRVRVTGLARGRQVVVEGTVSQAPTVAEATVFLDRKVRSRSPWRLAGRRDVEVLEGGFATRLARPNGVSCRARVVYRDGTVRASGQDVFAC